MTEIMSVPEFKHGMMRLAREAEPIEHGDVWRAWRVVCAYMDADEGAQQDCSEMLREDLAALDHDGHATDD